MKSMPIRCQSILRDLCVLILSFALCGCDVTQGTSLFYDDFEDNDLSQPAPGWQDEGGQYDAKTILAADLLGDNNVLYLEGPPEIVGGYYLGGGLSHQLGETGKGIRPDYVSFYFIPGPKPVYSCAFSTFSLSGESWPSHELSTGIHFAFCDERIDVNNFSVMPYPNMHVYKVEFRNINWDYGYPEAIEKPRFNLFINDQLVKNCIPFQNQLISFTRLDIYHYKSGQSWWDNISMSINSAEEPCFCTEEIHNEVYSDTYDSAPFSTQTPTQPSRLTLTVPPTATFTPEPSSVTAITTANCRSGPDTQFDILSSLHEGQTALVDGRNAEGTWFWVRQVRGVEHCWISKITVEINFDPADIKVVAAPSTPIPEPTRTLTATLKTASEQGCTVRQLSGAIICVVPCPQGAVPGEPCTP